MRSRVLRFSILAILGIAGCRQRLSYVRIENTPVTIPADWKHLQLNPGLVVATWRSQILRMTFSKELGSSIDPPGLTVENGQTVVPEVEMLDSDGKEYRLKFSGFSNANMINFENDSIPQGTQFRELVLRCSLPITFSNIVWFSYMPEDTKTGMP